MRKPNPQTHQACRSLLQKAVRRGSISLTRKIAHHLQSIGDADWLKTRTAIITFEECWPLGTNLHLKTDFEGILDTSHELRNEMMEELTVGEEEKGGLWQRVRSKEQPEHGKMKQNEPPDERKRGKIRQRRHEHSLGEVQGTFPISRAREATGQRSVSRG